MYTNGLKRSIDICVSLFGLMVAAPVCALIAALLWADLGDSPLFRQMRPGKEGEPFELVKFRTMTDARDDEGNLLPDEARLTGLGRLMRRLSLDELPELWNVLKGDMSIVGPRPLRMEYLRLYTPQQARRHEVRPGITGWAQVNGRNSITWTEKFSLDVWYVDNISLMLDIRICRMTALQVIRQRGISAAGSATMPRFEGTDETPREGRTCRT